MKKGILSIRDTTYTILVHCMHDINSQRNMQFWVDNKQAKNLFLHYCTDGLILECKFLSNYL